ncbi:MAG: sensor histidine kinase, partial [Cyclobacteriaceae bacterium]
APETVLKLSELMSYVIYEGKQQKVPLVKEINYIENFLDLERLRFGKRLKVNFKKEGALTGKSIAPLILISFIENGFKHGVHPSSNTIHIDILLKATDSSLIFVVENDKHLPQVNGAKKPNGIGIKNSRRRLDLIYHKDYNLDILESQNKYKVSLKIPAHEN